jgi:hypothetical protein
MVVNSFVRFVSIESVQEGIQMDASTLAGSVAATLGSETAAEVKKQLKTGVRRDLGMAELIATAAFIVQCAQLALQYWVPGGDGKALAERLDSQAEKPVQLDAQKRREILQLIANELSTAK